MVMYSHTHTWEEMSRTLPWWARCLGPFVIPVWTRLGAGNFTVGEDCGIEGCGKGLPQHKGNCHCSRCSPSRVKGDLSRHG